MFTAGKRAVDICLSLIALLMLLPLFGVIALLIYFDSEGPVFYRQKRVGKDGQPFLIYKFRTMRIGTPEVSTEALGNPENYVTKTGVWLRKLSLDELPQLINILLGEMSIVGPRPALHNQYELIRMREQSGVHKVRPGLTGYAQVKGRDLLSDQEKVTYDVYYVEHLSFSFDLKVIWWTFRCVVKSEGVRTDF